jgi:hypothetical protein
MKTQLGDVFSFFWDDLCHLFDELAAVRGNGFIFYRLRNPLLTFFTPSFGQRRHSASQKFDKYCSNRIHIGLVSVVFSAGRLAFMTQFIAL